MERFGKFEIIEEIARGGMGIVYKAIDPERAGVIALKVLIAGDEAPEKTIQRFYKEAEAISRLQHPNIVRVLEIGETDGRHYYTMNYIEGLTLEEVIKKGGLKENDTSHIVKEVASALAYCHGMNIVHRDIKSSNIIIDKKTWLPKILDFGVAKDLVKVTQLTAEEEVLGTPQYMSPEQAAGDNTEVDHRSDIYSLGVVLYEMLTGRPPITAENYSQMIVKVIQGEKELPSYYNPQVNKQLEAICLKAMARRKEERYESGSDMANDLANYQTPKKCLAKAVTIIDKSLINVKKYAPFIFFGILVFVGLVSVGVGALTRWKVFDQKRSDLFTHLSHTIGENLRKIEKNPENLDLVAQQMRNAWRSFQIIDTIDPYGTTVKYADLYKEYQGMLGKILKDLTQRGKVLVKRKAIPEAYILAFYLYKIGQEQPFKSFEEVKNTIDLRGDLNYLQIQCNLSLKYKLFHIPKNLLQNTFSIQTGESLENLESGPYALLMEKDLYAPLFCKIQLESEPLSLQTELVEENKLPSSGFLFYRLQDYKVLPSFGMASQWVTYRDYYNYLKLQGKTIPEPLTSTFLEEKGSEAIVGLSLKEAQNFAAWSGKKLPTQEEWEWIAKEYNETEFPSTLLGELKKISFFQRILLPNTPELLQNGNTVLLKTNQSLEFTQNISDAKIRLVWAFEEGDNIKALQEKYQKELKNLDSLLNEVEYQYQNALNEIHRAYTGQSYSKVPAILSRITDWLNSQKQNRSLTNLCENKLKGLQLLTQLNPALWKALEKQLQTKIKMGDKLATLLSLAPESNSFQAKIGNQSKLYGIEEFSITNLIEIMTASKQEIPLAILFLYSENPEKGTDILQSQSGETLNAIHSLFPFFDKKYWPSYYAAKEKGFIFDQGKSWIFPSEANKLGYYFFEGSWVEAKVAHREGQLLFLENQVYNTIQAQTKGYLFKNNSWQTEDRYWKRVPNSTEIDFPNNPKEYFNTACWISEENLAVGTIRGELLVLDTLKNKLLYQEDTAFKKGIIAIKSYGNFGFVLTGSPGDIQLRNQSFQILKQCPKNISKEFEKEKFGEHLYFVDQNQALVFAEQEKKLYEISFDPPKSTLITPPGDALPLILELDGKKMLGIFAKGDKLFFYRDHQKFHEKNKAVTLENATRQRILFSSDFLKAASFTIGDTGTSVKIILLSFQPEIIDINVGEIVEAHAFNPSGNLLAIATQIGTVRIYQLKTAKDGKIATDQFLCEFPIKRDYKESTIQTTSLLFNTTGDALFTIGKINGERKIIRWEN
ncbi:MAG: protein kinase [Planctomycetota bacterium]